MKALLILWASWSLALPVLAADAGPGAEIKVGKWIGFLQVDGQSDAIALTMDSYLVKPEDVRAFPTEVLQFKLGLGGYQTSEYQTETFENPHYDFNQGRLTLDEPDNEMVVNAVVYTSPRLHIKGRVTLRSSARSATMYLAYQTDEPGGGGPVEQPAALVPSLAGQYEGQCAGESAVLQIETGKGLTDETPVPSAGLAHYRITGVVGVVNGICPSVALANRPSYCVDHGFSSATYDFFTGRLQLNGQLETDPCTRKGDTWTCRIGLLPKDATNRGLVRTSCDFKKVNSQVAPFKVFHRRYHLSPTPAQNKELPVWAPPRSEALVEALNGTFSGYLHHEYQDRYQPLRLEVNATTSTPNPHNENQVFISAISVLSFAHFASASGTGDSSTYWTQPFERRSFYLVPGFTLKGGQSDAFLQVTRWRQGYIAGVWYSRAFGRVGTFELIKGATYPALSLQAKVLGDITGEFRGPEAPGMDGDFIDVTLRFPRQPRSSDLSYLVFQGNYQLWAGGAGWPIQRIAYGAYDVYTGSLSFMLNASPTGEASLVTGTVDDRDTLNLFWPNDRAWAVGIFDSVVGPFRRAEE